MENSFENYWNEFYKTMSPEEINEINKHDIEISDHEYQEFKKNLANNHCYLCGLGLEEHDGNTPCLHWLLRPKGIKKRHIEKLFNSGVGYFRTSAYLKWLANTEIALGNINNLKSEINQNKKIELTVRYKNIEWSFSCGQNDFKGHKESYDGKHPHFHFEMKIDGKIFIKFNDLHCIINEEDLFHFRSLENKKAIPVEGHGAGIQEIIDNFSPDEILNSLSPTDDKKRETFHLQTLIVANEGETISGKDITKMIQESKKNNITLAKAAQKFNCKLTTFIGPGDGIPDLSKRSPKKKK